MVIFALTNSLAHKIEYHLQNDINKFSFFASLNIEYENGQTETCGASVISANWLLTSAACLESAKNIISYINVDEENRLRFIIDPDQLFKNPQYNSSRLINDIGLIKLSTSLNFTEIFQPIALSTAKSNNEILMIVGGIGTESIKSTKLTIISMAECKEAFSILRFGLTSFCAKSVEEEKLSCDKGIDKS